MYLVTNYTYLPLTNWFSAFSKFFHFNSRPECEEREPLIEAEKPSFHNNIWRALGKNVLTDILHFFSFVLKSGWLFACDQTLSRK